MKTLSVKVKLVKYKPMSNFAEEISYRDSVSQAWDTKKGQINTNEVT